MSQPNQDDIQKAQQFLERLQGLKDDTAVVLNVLYYGHTHKYYDPDNNAFRGILGYQANFGFLYSINEIFLESARSLQSIWEAHSSLNFPDPTNFNAGIARFALTQIINNPLNAFKVFEFLGNPSQITYVNAQNANGDHPNLAWHMRNTQPKLFAELDKAHPHWKMQLAALESDELMGNVVTIETQTEPYVIATAPSSKDDPIEQVREKIVQFERELTSREEENKALSIQLQQITADKEALEAKILAIEQQNQQLSQEIERYEAQIAGNEQDRSQTENALSSSKKAREKLFTEHRKLSDERVELLAREEELQQAKVRVAQDKAKLMAQKQTLEQQEKALTRDMQEAENSLCERMEKLKENERKVATAQEELAAREAELDAAKAVFAAQMEAMRADFKAESNALAEQKAALLAALTSHEDE